MALPDFKKIQQDKNAVPQWAEYLKDDEFTFKLTGEGQNLTATNKDGKFAFDAIKYTTAGTYTYTVSEVKGSLGGVEYDENTYPVTVTVKDNGDGTFTLIGQ